MAPHNAVAKGGKRKPVTLHNGTETTRANTPAPNSTRYLQQGGRSWTRRNPFLRSVHPRARHRPPIASVSIPAHWPQAASRPLSFHSHCTSCLKCPNLFSCNTDISPLQNLADVTPSKKPYPRCPLPALSSKLFW